MIKSQPAEVVAAMLVKLRIAIRPNDGVDAQWQVFKNFSPQAPSNSLFCFNEESDVMAKTMDNKVVVKPKVQIKVRSQDGDLAWEKCVEIVNGLTAVRRVNLTCLWNNEQKREQVLLKNVMLDAGPRLWVPAEESQRMVTFTMTVQLNVSEGT